MTYILLSSAKDAREITRAYYHYDTKDEMARQIIDYFEEYKKASNPELEDLEYPSDELFEFIDDFFDELVCLAREPNLPDLYIPYTTSWVKECIYAYLRSQCCIPDESQMSTIENGCASQIAMDTN